jgi:hypothetical protein
MAGMGERKENMELRAEEGKWRTEGVGVAIT